MQHYGLAFPNHFKCRNSCFAFPPMLQERRNLISYFGGLFAILRSALSLHNHAKEADTYILNVNCTQFQFQIGRLKKQICRFFKKILHHVHAEVSTLGSKLTLTWCTNTSSLWLIESSSEHLVF